MSEKKACPCCCEKITLHVQKRRKKMLINRLKRIEGQIKRHYRNDGE